MTPQPLYPECISNLAPEGQGKSATHYIPRREAHTLDWTVLEYVHSGVLTFRVRCIVQRPPYPRDGSSFCVRSNATFARR